jgi:hypothetical protein
MFSALIFLRPFLAWLVRFNWNLTLANLMLPVYKNRSALNFENTDGTLTANSQTFEAGEILVHPTAAPVGKWINIIYTRR